MVRCLIPHAARVGPRSTNGFGQAKVSTLQASTTLGDLASLLIRARPKVDSTPTGGRLGSGRTADSALRSHRCRSAGRARICDVAEALQLDFSHVAHLPHQMASTTPKGQAPLANP
jgi:hypothetical protein